MQQEPLLAGGSTLLRQPVAAWLRVIGRLRPGASVNGMAPHLTGVLRQWMEHDLISAQLYGVPFWDPLALAAAAGSLGTCAFFAALVPAGRAASISPMRALRTE